MLCLAARADFIDTVVPTIIVPNQQIGGDLLQIYNYPSSALYGVTTQGVNGGTTPTQSFVVGSGNLGLWGFDEGACAAIAAKGDIVCVTGDVDSAIWNAANTVWENFSRATSLANTLGGLGGSSSSLDLKAVYAIPGGATTMPTCNTLTTVMTSLVASGTPTANYTGCNPISWFSNSSRTAASQPMFASPVLTLTTGTTTDLQGHNLTIVAGREFLNCVNATLNGVDSILCDVNMTRINGASGSTLYMGATLLEQIPVANLYSAGSLKLAGSTDITWTPSYNSNGGSGTHYAVLSNTPFVTLFNGTLTIASVACPTTPQNYTGSTCYTVTDSGAGFVSGMAGALIETSPSGSNSIQCIIAGFTSTSVVTAACASTETAWTIGSAQTATVQGAPYQMALPVSMATGLNAGKFVSSSMYYVSNSALANWPWTAQLPSALRSATDGVVLFFGTTGIGKSNLYVAAIDADLITTSQSNYTQTASSTTGGLSSMWYVTAMSATNVPSWTQGSEDLAIPLITSWTQGSHAASYTTECAGEHSVEYSAGLSRWILSYGVSNCGGFIVRTGLAPWGPWSQETVVMNNNTVAQSSLNNTSSSGNYWGKNWYSLLPYQNKSGGVQPGFFNPMGSSVTATCSGCENGSATMLMNFPPPPGTVCSGTTSANNACNSLNPSGPWSTTASGYGFRFNPSQESISGQTVTRAIHFSTGNPYVIFEGLMTFSTPTGPSSASSGVSVVH